MFDFFKKKPPSETESISRLNSLAAEARLETVHEKGIVTAVMVLIDKTGSELAPYVQHKKSVVEFIARIEERITNEFDAYDEISTATRLVVDSNISGLLKWHLNQEKNIIVDPL
jgi:hypothetical protein